MKAVRSRPAVGRVFRPADTHTANASDAGRPFRPAVTPSQTIGPFFHDGLAWAATHEARRLAADDDEWRVAGAVTDANGDAVSDAMLEIWQPRPPRSSGTTVAAGFQRVYTDRAGRFAFTVRLARRVEAEDRIPTDAQTDPTVAHVTLFARGLLGALRTGLYVGASPRQLTAIPGLQDIPEERLATLIPLRVDVDRRTLDWSVRLQGDNETVFFELK